MDKVKRYMKGPGFISLAIGMVAGLAIGQATSVAEKVRKTLANTFGVELEALPAAIPERKE